MEVRDRVYVSAALPSEDDLTYSLNRSLIVLKALSGHGRQEKHPLPLWESNHYPAVFQPLAQLLLVK